MPSTATAPAPRLVESELRTLYRRQRRQRRQQSAAGRKRLRMRRLLVWVVILFFAAMGRWASKAELEEVVRGVGKVIPDSSTQVIQSLEGGIIREMSVREGQSVAKGDLLVKLHDAQYSSAYEKEMATRNVLRARMVRLLAEGRQLEVLEFPEDLVSGQLALVEMERELFLARKRDQELEADYIGRRLSKQREMLERMMPAIRNGTVPQLERLRMESEIAGLEGQLATLDSKFAREAMERHDGESAELRALEESLHASRDRLERTSIYSPIDGVVNAIFIDTAERVVSGGQAIMEIVPLDDDLLIEAKLRPQDIAFIKKDLPARVRFTAFDATIYGGLEGVVETIGVDTMTTEEGDVYYPIKIRTAESTLGMDPKTGTPLVLMPGMVTEVDIITGSKTLLDYLLKPVNRAKLRALRES